MTSSNGIPALVSASVAGVVFDMAVIYRAGRNAQERETGTPTSAYAPGGYLKPDGTAGAPAG